MNETVTLISIPNAMLSDAGLSIMFEFIEEQQSLKVLKIYNNIMHIIGLGYELPLLFTATAALATALRMKNNLETLELHGFFINHADLGILCKSL